MSHNLNNPVRVEVPLDAWDAIGSDDADPRARLLCTMTINGTYMHLEAWAVQATAAGSQIVDDGVADEKLEALYDMMDCSGFQTTTIEGREYVLLASPFAR